MEYMCAVLRQVDPLSTISAAILLTFYVIFLNVHQRNKYEVSLYSTYYAHPIKQCNYKINSSMTG